MFRILVVDDTKSVHAYIKGLFAKVSEIELTSVYHGGEAVELLKETQGYDLIFLDWEMPVLNGPDAFLGFQALGIRIPVIMMTSKNNPEDIRKMLAMGVSEYMMKPFTADIVFEKIEFVTGRGFSHAA